MKYSISLFLFLIFSSVLGQSLKEVREVFHKAVLDPQESRTFHDYMSEIKDQDLTFQAYSAVSEAMLAQVLWNPFSKLSQVVKYDKLMGKIVKLDPDNVEIRFLRLAIEYNLPSFLGMSEHINEDLEKIKSASHMTSIDVDPSYGRYIFYFLEQTNLCSGDELLAIKSSLNYQSSY